LKGAWHVRSVPPSPRLSISCRSRTDTARSAKSHFVYRLSHFSMCVGRHSYSARWGRQACPAPTPTSGFRNRSSTEWSNIRSSGELKTHHIQDSAGLRIALRRFQISGSMQKRVPQGHAPDGTSLKTFLNRVSWVLERLAGNAKLDPALLQENSLLGLP
jgi:hypothetical protein